MRAAGAHHRRVEGACARHACISTGRHRRWSTAGPSSRLCSRAAMGSCGFRVGHGEHGEQQQSPSGCAETPLRLTIKREPAARSRGGISSWSGEYARARGSSCPAKTRIPRRRWGASCSSATGQKRVAETRAVRCQRNAHGQRQQRQGSRGSRGNFTLPRGDAYRGGAGRGTRTRAFATSAPHCLTARCEPRAWRAR